MWKEWIPWKYLLRRLSRAHGYIDPINILQQFNRFSKPSEVLAPGELLRASLIFHARALINSQAIQHNLDWLWPYWIEQQFSPHSASFIPRAFSVTHTNITHRNWTAVGIPGVDEMPIVDPRGLITPHYDGWSLDFWIVDAQGEALCPSKAHQVTQRMGFESNIFVETGAQDQTRSLHTVVHLQQESNEVFCLINIAGNAPEGSYLVVAVRPFNPEGISFIHTVERESNRIKVNKRDYLLFERAPETVYFSNYHEGDVFHKLSTNAGPADSFANCDVGMATAAAIFPFDSSRSLDLTAALPLTKKQTTTFPARKSHRTPLDKWDDALQQTCCMTCPDQTIQTVFSGALQAVVLHCAHTVYAGPYTYKRFWFRDAVLISHALLYCNSKPTVSRIIDTFDEKMTAFGYYLSQNGEWDSNGQVLWLLQLYNELDGVRLPGSLCKSVIKAARWIQKKRVHRPGDELYEGLLPAGFSAEHLGPNDHYYWDNFWSIAGLQAAAGFLRMYGGYEQKARACEIEADHLFKAVHTTLDTVERQTGRIALAASPQRRMDSGAVGSVVCSYPLQLVAPDDRRLRATVDFLHSNCLINNAFFHDISHSGINPYLTLHIAQALLRNADTRFWPMVKQIAKLASPTGQWPEAIHPRIETGCMGDGQHIWAAAEFLLMIRMMFIREEPERREVIVGSGIPDEWLKPGAEMTFGPTPTRYGTVTLHIEVKKSSVSVQADGFTAGSGCSIFVQAGSASRTIAPEKVRPSLHVELERESHA
ncbi:MAG: hypothetical protein GF398_18965 [Chitinivibrionales bacterium]|nr:hypothetical protein [Chitinivibrionales bacterium]